MDPYERPRDEILQELALLAQRLAEPVDNNFAERIEMRSRQHQLRHELASWPLSSAELSVLEQKLTHLKQRRDDLLRSRPNVTAMTDGGEGSDAAIMQQFAWDYDESLGRTEITQQIVDLEQRLRGALDKA